LSKLPTVCILVGGLGTRLGNAAATTPKALTEVAGEPFLLHQLRLLARHGARHVVLCVGHLGEQIEAEIGWDRFGIDIRYSYDGPRLDGTLGAIRRARPLLGDRFLVLYGDTYLQVDYEVFSANWVKSGLSGAMAVLHNQGRWDQSNAIYADGRVVRYEKGTDDPTMEWIDYGLGALRSEVLDLVGLGKHDLSALYQELARQSQLFGFEATERFFEIGTPAALAETREFFVAIREQLRHLDRGPARSNEEE
jgi:N-acetyl-alpha-D-muramate 1-phosphate uridylyltransferase